VRLPFSKGLKQMAKIALIASFAALGALTGGLAWAGYLGFGIAGSAFGAIALGAGVGGAVGQLQTELVFPGSEPRWFEEEGEAADDKSN
jgi:hypothetical protein